LELAEKDALIAELKEQLATAQAGGSNAASSSEANREELTQCQRERDQALREFAELQQSYADLEEYKKSMQEDHDKADKKLASNMDTIHKLNHDKERKYKEINDLKDAARIIIDMVQPPHLDVFDSRFVVEQLRLVPGWLKKAPNR